MNLEKTEKLKLVVYENNTKNIIDYRKIMTFDKQMSKYPTKLVFNKTDIVFVKSTNITPGIEVNYTLGNFLNYALKKETYEKIKERCKMLIHCIEVEENMSFLFYHFNFSCLDIFLYIIFFDKN